MGDKEAIKILTAALKMAKSNSSKYWTPKLNRIIDEAIEIGNKYE